MTARFKVTLSDDALLDLREIHDAIAARNGRATAALFLENMLDKIATLEQFPRRGSIPPDIGILAGDEFRKIAMRAHRIFYRVKHDEVEILLIADARRDLRSLLQRRLLRGG